MSSVCFTNTLHKLCMHNFTNAHKSVLLRINFSSSAALHTKKPTSPNTGPEPNYQKLSPSTLKKFEFKNFQMKSNKEIMPRIEIVRRQTLFFSHLNVYRKTPFLLQDTKLKKKKKKIFSDRK